MKGGIGWKLITLARYNFEAVQKYVYTSIVHLLNLEQTNVGIKPNNALLVS